MLPLIYGGSLMSTVAHPGSIATTHRSPAGNFSPAAFTRSAAVNSAAESRRNTPFSESAHRDLSPAARELAQEIDRYKFRHRRRFINYEEILSVVKTLGYRKDLS